MNISRSEGRALGFMPAERWQILALVVVLQSVSVGITSYCFTFWITPWMEEFSLSRREVISAMTFHLYAMGLWAVLLGRFMDIFPAKYLVACGVGAFGLGMCLISAAPGMLMIILVYIFVLPVSTNLAGALGAVTLIARNFDERRGLALGIATLGTSLGGILFPNVVAYLLEGFGWRQTFLILGMGAAIVLLPLTLLILRNEQGHADAGNTQATSKEGGWISLISQRNFWVLCIVYLMAWMTFSALQNNIGPYAEDLGVDPTRAAFIVSVFSLSMVFGKLITGALADLADNRLLFSAASILVALAAILLAMFPNYESALIAFAILGFGSGAYLPLKAMMFARAFGPKAVGRVIGLSSPIVTLFAVGPLIAGWLRDETSSYELVFQSACGLALLTVPVVMLLRFRKT